MKELQELFPKATERQIKKAVRAAWLDSEERSEAMSRMTPAELKKRRFK